MPRRKRSSAKSQSRKRGRRRKRSLPFSLVRLTRDGSWWQSQLLANSRGKHRRQLVVDYWAVLPCFGEDF